MPEPEAGKMVRGNGADRQFINYISALSSLFNYRVVLHRFEKDLSILKVLSIGNDQLLAGAGLDGINFPDYREYLFRQFAMRKMVNCHAFIYFSPNASV